jgi:hypothetical protein
MYSIPAPFLVSDCNKINYQREKMTSEVSEKSFNTQLGTCLHDIEKVTEKTSFSGKANLTASAELMC